MLFDFKQEQEVGFWMKNTYIPLDMIFIRADGTIRRIAANTEPLSERTVPSGGPVALCAGGDRRHRPEARNRARGQGHRGPVALNAGFSAHRVWPTLAGNGSRIVRDDADRLGAANTP